MHEVYALSVTHKHIYTHSKNNNAAAAFCFNQSNLWHWYGNGIIVMHSYTLTCSHSALLYYSVSKMEKLSAQLQMFTKEIGVIICTFSIAL